MDGIHSSLEGIIRALDKPPRDEAFMPVHNMYSGRGYLDSDEDDDDDDEVMRGMYNHGSETSSDSSYEYDYSDQDDDDGRTAPTVRFRRQPVISNGHHDNMTLDDQNSDADDLDELPEWFQWQPIEHSKILMLPLVTGAPLVMLLGGELLLTVMALGALITHLTNEAGSPKNASHSCMLSILCAVIVVSYNIIPLIIWRSVWYIMLLAVALVYISLTGSWILLLTNHFCKFDPHLSLYLEGMLLTAYPVAGIILTTWTVGMVLGLQVTPYVLLVSGFFFCRVFLKPAESSFIKPDCPSGPRRLIVEPWTCVIIISWLTLAPSGLYLFVTSNSDATYAVVLGNIMNVISILSASVFVSTFLHMDPVMECFEVTMEMILLVRKGVVIATILSWTLSFYFHGYQPILLWPLVFLCAWSGLGLALSKIPRHQKFDGVVFTLTLVILSAVLMIEAPWTLHPVSDGDEWSMELIYVAISTHVLVCVVVVCGSKYISTQLFSCLVLLHSIVFSSQMSLLYQSDMLSVTTVIFSHIFCSYVVIRMYHVNRTMWQHALLTIATHLTSVLITMTTVYIPSNQPWSVFIVKGVTLYTLVAIFVQIIVMEKDQFVDIILMETNKVIDITKFTRYVSATATLSMVYVWLEDDLLKLLSHTEHGSKPVLALGVCCIVSSIPALKLSLFHRTAQDRTRLFGLGLMGFGLVLVLTQPNITPHLFDVVKLLLVLSLLCGGALVLLVYRIRSHMILYLLCLVTGSSLGTVLYSLLFSGSAPDGVMMFMYSVNVTLWLAMAVNCLKISIKSDRHLYFMSMTLGVLVVVMVMSDLLSHGAGLTEATPGRVGAVATSVVVAMLVKSQSLIRLPQLSRDVSHVSKLPVVGNLATVTSVVLLLSLTQAVPLPADLWILISTSVLLFLRRDQSSVLLRDLTQRNHMTPTLVATLCVLVGSIVYYNPLMSTENRSLTDSLCATLELMCLLLTIPVMVTLVLVLWYGCFRGLRWYGDRSQALAVLYLTPFFFCFLLAPIATTYHSWIYAVAGIASATYLWQHKIAFSLM